MQKEDKIQQIMTLAGVLPRDYERAAENYTTLTETELDERLVELRTAEAKIKAWRNRRSAGDVTEPPGHVAAARVSTASPLQGRGTAHRSPDGFKHHVSALVHLIERLKQWQPPLTEALAVEIASQVEKLATLKDEPIDAGSTASSIWPIDAMGRPNETSMATDIRADVARCLVDQIEAAVHHPLLWSGGAKLAPFETIEALARLENHILSYRPDAIVAVNEEGRAVARMALHDLGLNLPLVSVRGAADSELRWDEQENLHRTLNSVFVIGHVGWSGATMLRTIELVRSRYRTDAVFGAVLASSMEAVELLQNRSAFLYHHLSADQHVELTVDISHGVIITEDGYRLRPWNTDADHWVTISRNRLSVARADIAVRYPGERPY